MIGNKSKRTLGIAALLVLGTVAGFLVAAGTSGAEYATVGTVGSDSQAFQMPVQDEDQRVLFTLQADDGTTQEPSISFALYDASDSFFTEFQLSGNGDEAEVILDEPGQWVLFVTDRENAQLAVQYEGASEESDVELAEIPVEEERTSVAEQDGGALDEQVAFRLDQRPASVFLEYSGDIQGLDAQVTSEDGVVYSLSDANANTTEDGVQRAGDAQLESENLAAGTYEVTAKADDFDGELVFVEETYERQARASADKPGEDVEKNVTSPVESEEHSVVAEIGEHEAHEFSTAGATNVTFVVAENERAELRIYNSSDRVVKEVEVDGYESSSWWDHDENGSEDANVSTETVALEESGEYVAYATYVSDEDAPVRAVVPVEDAPAGEQLEIQTEEKSFEANTTAWNTTIEGALLDVSAHQGQMVGTGSSVTVTQETGTVYHQESEVSAFGGSMVMHHEENPELFTDGPVDVEMSEDAETELSLTYYLR